MTDLVYSVSDVFNAKDREGCLQQHGCLAFSIPAYQRGYKWGSETNQPVERLLNDLTLAWRKQAKEYLLQAITLKKVSGEPGDSVLEVIDGQQRLTTLFILLHVLHQDAPCIAAGKLRYRIRPELESLVKSIVSAGTKECENFTQLIAENQVDGESRQDCFYLKCAVLRCMHSVQTLGGEASSFGEFVRNQVKLMVNIVEPHIRGEVIFGNLNTNRVPLTETELIKGLLLTRVGREPSGLRPRRYREVLELRIQIGRQWDELVHWSNLPEIKTLYFPGHRDGMTGLLHLLARKRGFKALDNPSQPQEKPLFEYFLGQADLNLIFEELTGTADQLRDWFGDLSTYHFIGFCAQVHSGLKREPFLTELLGKRTKSELLRHLYAERTRILKANTAQNTASLVSELAYNESKDQITAILLAMSVFHKNSSGRFDFCAYQTEDWSLEHIFPQTPFGKDATPSPAQMEDIIDLVSQNENGEPDEGLRDKLCLLQSEKDPASFRQQVGERLKSIKVLHSIGNLCLLSRKDNSSMGCGMFDNKRVVIRRRIAQGSFVPRHTYEVFSKMILDEEGRLDVWSRKDILQHQAKIENRISELVEEQV